MTVRVVILLQGITFKCMCIGKEELQTGRINVKSLCILIARKFHICSLRDMMCLVVQHMIEHSWAFFQEHVLVPEAGEKAEQKVKI